MGSPLDIRRVIGLSYRPVFIAQRRIERLDWLRVQLAEVLDGSASAMRIASADGGTIDRARPRVDELVSAAPIGSGRRTPWKPA